MLMNQLAGGLKPSRVRSCRWMANTHSDERVRLVGRSKRSPRIRVRGGLEESTPSPRGEAMPELLDFLGEILNAHQQRSHHAPEQLGVFVRRHLLRGTLSAFE